MSKKLRQVTNLCSAALMLSPVFMGALQQSAPIVANAKARRSRKTAKSNHTMRLSASRGKRANRSKKNKKSKTAKSKSTGTLSFPGYQPISINATPAQIGKEFGIKVNKKTAKKLGKYSSDAKKYAKKHARKNKSMKVDFRKITKKSKKSKKGKRSHKSNKVKAAEKSAEAHDLKVSQSLASENSSSSSNQYIDVGTYDDIVNDSQFTNSDKAILLSAEADNTSQTNSDVSVGAFDPSAASQITFSADSVAPSGDVTTVNNDSTYSAGTGSSASGSDSDVLSVGPSDFQGSSAEDSVEDQIYNVGNQVISAKSAGTFDSFVNSQASSLVDQIYGTSSAVASAKSGSTYSSLYSEDQSAYKNLDSDDASFASLCNSSSDANASSSASSATSDSSSVSSNDSSNVSDNDSVSSSASDDTTEDQSSDDTQEAPSGVIDSLDSAAADFANAVQTAPISSSAKTSLKAEFSAKPESAASSFTSEVSNVSSSKVSADKPFQSAMTSMTVPSSNTASFDYSANPKKAASEASSALSSDGSGLTSSEKAAANSLNFTNDPLTADQSKQLTEDQSALADMIKGTNAGNHANVDSNNKAQGSVQNASSTLEQTPEMLNGTTSLMDKPSNGNVVMGPQSIQENNQKPDYSNTFMIYQQERLNDGTLMDHVVSYDSKINGWIPDSGIQASAQPNVVATPSGTYHFSDPSKDATYELPLGTSWSDPFVVNRADAVGADNLKVTAARTAKKNGKTVTSYYVQDADHPYINGWVNKDELSKDVAKGASSKQANTPKSTDSKITKFALNVEGNLTEAPVQVDADKAGTDSLTLPSYFNNDQAKALSGKRGTDIDWGNLNDNFFGKDKDMNKFYGSTTYYEQNGHIIYVPASDIKEEENSGKQLFHFVYKVDKTATRRANKHAKNGDILNIYYRRVQVSGPAVNKAKTPKNDSKVTTTQSNQKPSNDAANQKVSTPNK